MNICFFTHVGMLGGGEIWLLGAARVLARLGHGVSVVCPYRSALFDESLRQGLDLHGYTGTPGTPFQDPLLHFLRSRRVDVVYCTVIGAFCESALLEALVERLNTERARAGDRPAIVIVKTGLPPLDGLTPEHYGFGAGPTVRRLHVVSQAQVEAFRAWLPEAGDALEPFVEVCPEGIDVARFDPELPVRAEQRARLGLAADARVVTCLARLHVTKGVDNLLLAAAELRPRLPRLRVLIAGEGEERARLEGLRDHLGLADCASFLGHVTDTPGLLAASDVLCHPSLLDGLPNAVVEALALRLPVVASAVAGLPELLAEGAGLLVPPHDIRALVSALSDVLLDPERARALGAAGRRRVLAGWSLESCTAALARRLEAELLAFAADPRSRPAPPAPPRPQPIPVLFLLSALRTGGEETEVAILARHLDRRRFRPLVLSAHAVDEPAPAAERLQRAGVTLDTGCHALASLAEKVGYVIDCVRREGVRVVVACQDTLLAYHVFQHLAPEECRLIEHAGIPGELQRVPKDRSARCIGVSAAIAAEAAARLPRPEQAVYLPSMVDLAEFEGEERATLRAAWGFGDDVIALFVGRLDAKKSLDVLMAAAERLLPAQPCLRFLVVGGHDALQPEVGQQWLAAARARLDPARFAFIGPRSDVPRLLAAADLLVLPAHGEGMSHVINEAGAAGRAVVAADSGAAREQLEDGAAGLLVPWGDVDALVAALGRLAQDAALRARLGGRLRARVQREYAAHVVVRRWEALLAEVASETQPATRTPAVQVLDDERLPPFPLEIQIETNTACNATCVMCPYPEVTREVPQGRMDLPLYEKLLDECAGQRGLWRIEPFLNNEPFTDVRLVDWITLAKQRVPQAMVTVTTNGSLLFPRVTDRLVRSGLDAIWFSVNGASRETYEQIMGLSFDLVMGHIDYLLSVRPPSLRVFTNMIETVPMRGEIADNVQRWRALGVESGASPLANRAGNVKNFEALNYKTVAPAPVRLCDLLYHKMYVGWNGDVLLCCMDWRRRVVLGNARQQSLQAIWQGEPYRRYRQLHEEGRVGELDLCRDCSYVRS